MLLSEISNGMQKNMPPYLFLEALWEAKPNVVYLDKFREIMWGSDRSSWPVDDGNYRKVTIHRLRKRLKPFGIRIKNVCRYGYKLVMPKEAE